MKLYRVVFALAYLVASCLVSSSLSAQTAVQLGMLRTTTPWQTCVYDATNTCQAFLTLPNAGGAAALYPGMTIPSAALTGSTTIGGQPISLAGGFSTSGAYAVVLTATGATNVTLPTSGTLDTIAGRNTAIQTALPSTTAGQILTASGTAGLASAITPGTNVTAAITNILNASGGLLSYGAAPLAGIATAINGIVKGNGTGVVAAMAGTDYVAPSGSLAQGTGTIGIGSGALAGIYGNAGASAIRSTVAGGADVLQDYSGALTYLTCGQVLASLQYDCQVAGNLQVQGLAGTTGGTSVSVNAAGTFYPSGLPEAPNLWYNPCSAIDQAYVGNEQVVPNNGLSTYVPDRTNVQQVTPTPHLSAKQSTDGSAGCANSTKITVGFASSSSNAIGTGSKTFNMNGGLNFAAGEINVSAVQATNLANSMTGTVTSYSPTTGVLVLNVTAVTGSGTFSNWTIGTAGTTNRGVTAAVTSGSSSSGTNSITVASTAGAAYVAGAGVSDETGNTVIPAGSFILAITSGTTFTISQNLIANLASGTAFEIYGDNGVYSFENIGTEDASGFQYATANGRTATISFNVRSFGATGIAAMSFYGYTSVSTLGRSLAVPFPVTTNWTRVSLQIPADLAGSGSTWAIPNSYGGLWGAIGFTWECQGGTSCVNVAPSTWVNTTAVGGSTSQTMNLTGTVGAWVEYTAVKLELSPQATPFTPPRWQDELARLQGTYEKSYPQSTVPGSVITAGYDEIYQVNGASNFITQAGHEVRFSTKKRCTSPAVILYSPGTGAIGKSRDYVSTVDVTANSLQSTHDDGFAWYAAQNSTTTNAIQLGTAWTARCPF